jgi:uncharacterized protein with PIN domain
MSDFKAAGRSKPVVSPGQRPEAIFRFYGDLNDFLPEDRRQVNLAYPLNGSVAVKHPIEAMGVPHTEVDLILANSTPVDFSYLVQDGDKVSVYPAFSRLDLGSRPRLRPALPNPPGFVADVHLGRLVTYLRLLGFDTLYPDNHDDEVLAEIAHQEGRVLLTRDVRLLMRGVVTYGYWLRTKAPRQQLLAVLNRFKLRGFIQPWRRCLRCNGHLMPIEKEKILDRLEPKTKKYYHEFHICRSCQQIYWKGSHYRPLQQFVEAARQGQEPPILPAGTDL